VSTSLHQKVEELNMKLLKAEEEQIAKDYRYYMTDHDQKKQLKDLKQKLKDATELSGRLGKDKEELLAALYGGKQVRHALTFEGDIDGHHLQIRGMVPRGGPNSVNPPGPCMICERMITLATSDRCAQYGVRCQWAD